MLRLLDALEKPLDRPYKSEISAPRGVTATEAYSCQLHKDETGKSVRLRGVAIRNGRLVAKEYSEYADSLGIDSRAKDYPRHEHWNMQL